MRLDRFIARLADAPGTPPGAGTRLPVLRVVGYIIAVGLLAASIWFALGSLSAEQWAVLRGADPALLLALFGAVIVSSLVLPGLQFWLATIPFVTSRPLGLWTMLSLNAASWLLNYTPFKAGLIGRISYLKYLHGVGLLAALVSNMLIFALFGTACVITLFVTVWLRDFGPAWFVACALALLLASILLTVGFRSLVPSRVPLRGVLSSGSLSSAAYLLISLLLQCVILFFNALRWWLVFRILGANIDLSNAWILAIVHMLASLIGPANGLGLREWVVGMSGGLLLTGPGSAFSLADGLAASLVDRAAEALVIVLAGVLSLIFLPRFRAGKQAATGD